MAGGIYVLQESGQLVEMKEHEYDSEDLLQSLLARYPSLLAGDQIDPAAPRRWALVRREAALPSEEGGSDRWSVDHLFLDQDAIPTIIEVKRSSDTRIRREVVGQMLDYAANAVVYWLVERLRSMFDATHGDGAEEVLAGLVGDAPDADPEAFWQRAKTNLQAGRVRLVFVADIISSELQRVVEFLNQQMDPAQVLAVEIRQYVGQGLKTLVPRVIGQTAEAQQKKGTGTPVSGAGRWDETSFMSAITERKGEAVAGVARALLEWAQERGLRLWWGRGIRDGSFFPMLDRGGKTYWTVAVWTYGTLEIQFGQLKTSPPFDQEAQRMELRERLNAIPGVNIAAESVGKRPNVQLSIFTEPDRLRQLLAVLDWVVEQYGASR